MALLARRTVHAAVHVVASLVLGLVHLAGLVGNTLLVRVSVHTRVPSSVAGSGVTAVDHLLHRQLHAGPRSLAHQVHAVSDGRGGSLCPAGAAVLRNVLVLVPGGVVATVDVADVVALGNLLRLQVGVGQRRGDHLLLTLVDGAAVREVASTVVQTAHLVVQTHSLGHLRNGPRAHRLDAEVVLAAHDAEPALLSPVGSPRVTSDPVLLAVLLAPADHRDGVVHAGGASLVLEDASLVRLQLAGGIDGARDRTTGVDLLHHALLSGNASVLLHVVLGVVLHSVAGIVVTAVAADVDVRALHVLGLVAHAALGGDAALLHQHVRRQHATAAATIGSGGAVHNHLRRELSSRPSVLGHQTQTIRHRRGSSKRPAGAAVLRNMLVSGNRNVGNSVDITTRRLGEPSNSTDRSSREAPRST